MADAKPDLAQRYVNSFLRQVRWQPRQIATFAGALCYSKYGRFKRFLVVLFVRMAGGDTDTSHDYEYPTGRRSIALRLTSRSTYRPSNIRIPNRKQRRRSRQARVTKERSAATGWRPPLD